MFVVTVSAVFRGSPSPDRTAEALMRHDGVVTVRIGDAGRPSVFRMDVAAGEPATAGARGATVAAEVARRLGGEAAVESVTVVAEADREPEPPQA